MEWILILIGLFLLGCWTLTFNIGAGLQIIFSVFSPVILFGLIALLIWGCTKLNDRYWTSKSSTQQQRIHLRSQHWGIVFFTGVLIASLVEGIYGFFMKNSNVNMPKYLDYIIAITVLAISIFIAHRLISLITTIYHNHKFR